MNKLEFTKRDILLSQVKTMQALLDSPEDVLISSGAYDREVKVDI